MNTEQMEAENLDMPKAIKDLANPEYKGKIAVTDITSSSTAWLLIQGLISEYGEEEAKEILMDDDDIDHGIAKDFDLSAEKLKEANKYSKTGTRKAPTAYKFEKRQRKENPTKRSIIAELATFLRENSENTCENVEITNVERMIAFHVGENDYELTLIQKRKPKN